MIGKGATETRQFSLTVTLGSNRPMSDKLVRRNDSEIQATLPGVPENQTLITGKLLLNKFSWWTENFTYLHSLYCVGSLLCSADNTRNSAHFRSRGLAVLRDSSSGYSLLLTSCYCSPCPLKEQTTSKGMRDVPAGSSKQTKLFPRYICVAWLIWWHAE